MVNITGNAKFIVNTGKEDEDGEIIYSEVIVSSESIDWDSYCYDDREMGEEMCTVGTFDIDEAGEASIEIYEYPAGVFNTYNLNLPSDCECVELFHISN